MAFDVTNESSKESRLGFHHVLTISSDLVM